MIAWFARNSVAANLLMIAIMGLGIWTLATDRIPLEVFPDTPSRFLSRRHAGGSRGNDRSAH